MCNFIEHECGCKIHSFASKYDLKIKRRINSFKIICSINSQTRDLVRFFDIVIAVGS